MIICELTDGSEVLRFSKFDDIRAMHEANLNCRAHSDNNVSWRVSRSTDELIDDLVSAAIDYGSAIERLTGGQFDASEKCLEVSRNLVSRRIEFLESD